MYALIPSFAAAASASLANLFFRKSSLKQDVHGYLFCYYLISFLSTFAFYPSLTKIPFSPFLLAAGVFVGILNVLLMQVLSISLKYGPAGLTFAFQNASSIFPNALLFLIFGAAFEFIVTPYQVLGMSFVLLGLYFASWQDQPLHLSSRWFKWTVLGFLLQMFILTFLQWRCLLFSHFENHLLIPFHFEESCDAWFMLGFLGGALLLQALIFLYRQRFLKKSELIFGSLGGLTNGVGTYLLLLATRGALPAEKGLIFPGFAVSVILLCNLWGYMLYREEMNYKANALCLLGIIIASFG